VNRGIAPDDKRLDTPAARVLFGMQTIHVFNRGTVTVFGMQTIHVFDRVVVILCGMQTIHVFNRVAVIVFGWCTGSE
jgi:hypothetical protein